MAKSVTLVAPSLIGFSYRLCETPFRSVLQGFARRAFEPSAGRSPCGHPSRRAADQEAESRRHGARRDVRVLCGPGRETSAGRQWPASPCSGPAWRRACPLTRAASPRQRAGPDGRALAGALSPRRHGLVWHAPTRRDASTRQMSPAELVALVEGMALKPPRLSVSCHPPPRSFAAAKAQGWPAPSYGTVNAIVAALDPGMVTLAQDGPAAFRDRFELVHRHRAAMRPTQLWQADHTMLDLLILDEGWQAGRALG